MPKNKNIYKGGHYKMSKNNTQTNLKILLYSAILTERTINDYANERISKIEETDEKKQLVQIIKAYSKYQILLINLFAIKRLCILLLKLKPIKYYSYTSGEAVPLYKIGKFPFLGTLERNYSGPSEPMRVIKGENLLTDDDCIILYEKCSEYLLKGDVEKDWANTITDILEKHDEISSQKLFHTNQGGH